MVSKYFKDNIAILLDTKGKEYRMATSDLLDVSLVFSKDRPGHYDSYEGMLSEDMLNYKLTTEEQEYCLKVWRKHIIEHTLYDIVSASIIGKNPDEKDAVFLFEQLKKYMTIDIPLAVTLMQGVETWDPDGYMTFLQENKNNVLLPEEFRSFIAELIDFHEGKIHNISWPVTHGTVGDRYVSW